VGDALSPDSSNFSDSFPLARFPFATAKEQILSVRILLSFYLPFILSFLAVAKYSRIGMRRI